MPPTILIVEDERIVAKHLEVRLSRWGYRVSANVASGESALDQLAVVEPDLVLMDIRLAGRMDGIEAARRIARISAVPIVYMTAYGDDVTLARVKHTRPAGYLVKPYTDVELERVVEQALRWNKIPKPCLKD